LDCLTWFYSCSLFCLFWHYHVAFICAAQNSVVLVRALFAPVYCSCHLLDATLPFFILACTCGGYPLHYRVLLLLPVISSRNLQAADATTSRTVPYAGLLLPLLRLLYLGLQRSLEQFTLRIWVGFTLRHYVPVVTFTCAAIAQLRTLLPSLYGSRDDNRYSSRPYLGLPLYRIFRCAPRFHAGATAYVLVFPAGAGGGGGWRGGGGGGGSFCSSHSHLVPARDGLALPGTARHFAGLPTLRLRFAPFRRTDGARLRWDRYRERDIAALPRGIHCTLRILPLHHWRWRYGYSFLAVAFYALYAMNLPF